MRLFKEELATSSTNLPKLLQIFQQATEQKNIGRIVNLFASEIINFFPTISPGFISNESISVAEKIEIISSYFDNFAENFNQADFSEIEIIYKTENISLIHCQCRFSNSENKKYIITNFQILSKDDKIISFHSQQQPQQKLASLAAQETITRQIADLEIIITTAQENQRLQRNSDIKSAGKLISSASSNLEIA